MGVSAAIAGVVVAAGGAEMSMEAQRKASHESRDATLRLAQQLNQAPPVMPVADGEATAAARKRSMQAQVARRGRSSTILSDPSEVLGG